MIENIKFVPYVPVVTDVRVRLQLTKRGQVFFYLPDAVVDVCALRRKGVVGYVSVVYPEKADKWGMRVTLTIPESAYRPPERIKERLKEFEENIKEEKLGRKDLEF
jgi:hypothetical protein